MKRAVKFPNKYKLQNNCLLNLNTFTIKFIFGTCEF